MKISLFAALLFAQLAACAQADSTVTFTLSKSSDNPADWKWLNNTLRDFEGKTIYGSDTAKAMFICFDETQNLKLFKGYYILRWMVRVKGWEISQRKGYTIVLDTIPVFDKNSSFSEMKYYPVYRYLEGAGPAEILNGRSLKTEIPHPEDCLDHRRKPFPARISILGAYFFGWQ